MFHSANGNQFLFRISVKNPPAVNKRSVCGEKDNAIPEKKRRALFNKKNTSLMSLNFSVMQVKWFLAVVYSDLEYLQHLLF